MVYDVENMSDDIICFLQTFLDDFRAGDEGYITTEDLELLMRTQGDKVSPG